MQSPQQAITHTNQPLHPPSPPQGTASVSDLHTVSSVPDLNCMLGAPWPPMYGTCHVCHAATFENKVSVRE